MVDERRVRRLLQRIADDLAWLAERRAGDRPALRADADRLAAQLDRVDRLAAFVAAVSRWIAG